MKVTEEELRAIQGTKFNATILKLKADSAALESARAVAESKLAEAEYENTLLKVYLNYGLTQDHIINETTGDISKKEDKSDKNTESQND